MLGKPGKVWPTKRGSTLYIMKMLEATGWESLGGTKSAGKRGNGHKTQDAFVGVIGRHLEVSGSRECINDAFSLTVASFHAKTPLYLSACKHSNSYIYRMLIRFLREKRS